MPILFDLKNYISSCYIETGILYGESISKAIQSGFDKIYAIDINEKFVTENLKRFENEVNTGKVTIMQGLSTDILPKVLDTINEKSTIFLDAHDLEYEGIETHLYDKENECPIIKELNIISNHQVKEHTIIIDDIMMIVSDFGWSKGYNINLDTIKNLILSINKNYKFEIIQDHNGCLICYI
jgi:hypothetical protein